MNKPIVQDFEVAETHERRIIVWTTLFIFGMLILCQVLMLIRGMPLSYFLVLILIPIGLCGWWTYKQAGSELREHALTNWQLTDHGLEWTNPVEGDGVFRWDEINDISQFIGGILIKCQKTPPDGGLGYELRFRLYVSKEDGTQLQEEWKKRVCNSAQ